jgi:hypothetical protein
MMDGVLGSLYLWLMSRDDYLSFLRGMTNAADANFMDTNNGSRVTWRATRFKKQNEG